MRTAELLEARLALVARVHHAELAATRGELAHAAAALVRGRSHELGNSVQIVRLAALELERRGAGGDDPELRALLGDLSGAADQAATTLAELLALARPPERTAAGAEVAGVVRRAVEAARPAVAAPVELACEVAEDVRALATAEELEAMVIAALLDADGATRVRLLVRARVIQGRPWVQLVRVDDRRRDASGFEHGIEAIAAAAGGEVSLSEGRDGWELAIELPGPAAPGTL